MKKILFCLCLCLCLCICLLKLDCNPQLLHLISIDRYQVKNLKNENGHNLLIKELTKVICQRSSNHLLNVRTIFFLQFSLSLSLQKLDCTPQLLHLVIAIDHSPQQLQFKMVPMGRFPQICCFFNLFFWTMFDQDMSLGNLVIEKS